MPDLHRYGPHRDQVADAWMPTRGEPAAHPVVVVLHGGLWLRPYGRDLMASVCADLAERGWLAWNLEYRRVGSRWSGGGWPATFADVAAGIDRLAAHPDIADIGRVAVLGHSAGAQLAMWAAARPHLPDGAAGAGPIVRVRAAISLAGVLDLVGAARDGSAALSGAVVRFLGGRPDEVPDRYRLASPVERVPLGVPQLVVHGEHDGTVSPDQSREYARRSRVAGDDVDLVVVPGAGHMDPVDPRSAAWAAVTAWLTSGPAGSWGPGADCGG